ncbi:NACHT domain-containing protein [Cladophialophora immunda]|nr:NACHT domain-containing protein [Cladophialophora immunda]
MSSPLPLSIYIVARSLFLVFLSKVLERLRFALAFGKDVLAEATKVQHSPSAQRVAASLGEIYRALLSFFRDVFRIFRKKDGSECPIDTSSSVVTHSYVGSGSKTVLMGKLMWRPFDERFQDTLAAMTMYYTRVKDDLLLILAQQSGQSTERLAEEIIRASGANNPAREELRDIRESNSNILKQLQDTAFDRVLKWIQPPEFNSELIQSRDLLENDTTNWIYDDKAFIEWMHAESTAPPGSVERPKSFGTNSLWINGNPGVGKTILAASVVTKLRNGYCDGYILYFFFAASSPTKTQTISAVRALLAQLLQHRRSEQQILDRFLFMMEGLSGGQLTSTIDDLMDLLRICLEEQGTTWMIIDAIDECDDNNSLLKHLLTLSAIKTTKLLMLSRPNVRGLMKSTCKQLRLRENKPALSRDIRIYVSRLINELVDDGELVADEDDMPNLIDRLVLGADGMFLWARLMMSYLASPLLSPHSRMQTILNVVLPEGLEEMYDRILRAILRGGTTQQLLARRIFTWLMHSVAPLSIQQLHDAIVVEEAQNSVIHETSNYTDFAQTILIACGSLVEQRYEDPSKPTKMVVKFIHISVAEYFNYLASNPEQNQYLVVKGSSKAFLCDKPLASMVIAKNCLLYLTYHFPAQPLSGLVTENVDHDQLSASFPLAPYAVCYWAQHLLSSTEPSINKSDTESEFVVLAEVIAAFLSKPTVLTTWIQAFYIFSNQLNLGLPSDELVTWSDFARGKTVLCPALFDFPKLCSDTLEFGQELSTLKKEWADNLRKSPVLIWNEVTAFTKCRFLVETELTKAIPLAVGEPETTKGSSKSLCSVSTMSPCGTFIAILTIWPSSLFEYVWEDMDVLVAAHELRDICSGWVCRYEAWSTHVEPKRLFEIQIPLDSDEIWLLMRQSLIRDSTGWRIAFPVSISEDAMSFTVLRTLFRIQSEKYRPEITYKSFTIDTNFSPGLRKAWSECRSMPDIQGYHRIYTYSFHFGTGGRLFFSDYEHANSNHFAIFNQISNAGEVELVRFAVGNGTQPPITKVAFHSSEPLMVLINDSVQVWNYDENCMSTLVTPSFLIRSVCISSCGRFAVLSGDSQTQVVSLEDFIKPSVAMQSSTSEPSATSAASQEILPFNMHPGQTLKSSSTYVAGNTASGTVSVVGKLGSVHLVHNTAKGEESIPVVSLPRRREIVQAQVDLKLPASSDPFYSIVINNVAQPWYNFSQPSDEHFPLLVRRDPRVVMWQGRGAGYNGETDGELSSGGPSYRKKLDWSSPAA